MMRRCCCTSAFAALVGGGAPRNASTGKIPPTPVNRDCIRPVAATKNLHGTADTLVLMKEDITGNYSAMAVGESGRARCVACNLPLDPGSLRIGIFAAGTGDFKIARYAHAACFRTVTTRLYPGCMTNFSAVEGVDTLSPEHFDLLVRLVLRGAADGNALLKAVTQAGDIEAQRVALSTVMEALHERGDTASMRQVLVMSLSGKVQQREAITKKIKKIDRASLIPMVADLVVFGEPLECDVCQAPMWLRGAPMRYACCGFLDEYTPCGAECGETATARRPWQVLADSDIKSLTVPRIDVGRALDEAVKQHPDTLGRNISPAAIEKAVTDAGTTFEGRLIYFASTNTLQQSAVTDAGATTVDDIDKAISSAAADDNSPVIGVSAKDTAESKRTAERVLWVTPGFIDLSLKMARCLSVTEGQDHLLHGLVIDEAAKKRLQAAAEGTKRQQERKSGETKTVVARGSVPIDNECSISSDAGLIFDNYSATLSKVDVASGKNTIYVLQIIKLDAGGYVFFRRWGRLGDALRSGKKEESFASVERAKAQFSKLFEERTGNLWEDGPANFTKKAGMYHWVDAATSDEANAPVPSTPATEGAKASATTAGLQLAPRTLELLQLLFDKEVITSAMKSMEIDVDKMPLTSLTQAAVAAGNDALLKINAIVCPPSVTAPAKRGKKKAAAGPTPAAQPAVDITDPKAVAQLRALSNRFYSAIPHVIPFGTDPATVLIDTPVKIAAKTQLLDELRDILLTKKIMADGVPSEHSHYSALKADLEHLASTHDDHKMAVKYALNTHASTHGAFRIHDVWRVARHDEDARYAPWQKDKNRKLLWHGSRLTNWVRILAQGLRIAPPEAPSTGYMFGKGIYFADMFTKSANYCFLRGRQDPGLMCLCEVALGAPAVRYNSDYITALPKSQLHCFARGRTMPNPAEDITLPDGVVVPLGTNHQPSLPGGSSLLYNEFIVYDESQVRIRYLLRVSQG
jgi:predicted DNA-binding WGR domain protein